MTIITPSQWLADLVGQSYLKEYPVKVVHNGIDTNIFKPTESDIRDRYGLEDKKIVLGVAQNWGESKGLGDFVKLSQMLDESYKIVLVGLTEKQVTELPDNMIKITRTKNATELAQWYTTADLFVNTTYEDTYPTVNLEAQACGTPAVTYRTGGSPESVPEEHVVDQGNINLLVRMIKELCGANPTGVRVLDTEKYDRKSRYSEIISTYTDNKAAQHLEKNK
jgi:glycosyltransferase involved in cell wall biosynthesis